MYIFKKISSQFNSMLVCVSILLSTFCSPAAYAAEGFVKGQVEFIRTHSAIIDPAWGPPNAWFTLKGVGQAGACGKWYEWVLFVVSDKQALVFVLTAQASNQEVAVFFRDTVIVNGYCVAAYVTIGNSVPLR